MDYCNSFNGMAYHHHSQQHNHEPRYKNAMMKVGYNNNHNSLYGHNQHISWNGMHHQYGNRNHSMPYYYDSYRGNMVQNCFQSSYANNFDSSHESSTATLPTAPVYRSRYGNYQMCDTQQFYPSTESNRTDYMALNGSMGRGVNPLSSGMAVSEPRSHQPYMYDSAVHHSHHMRIPLNHRAIDSHPKTRQFETGPYPAWYGYQEPSNESNHQYYQYPTINNSNYNEYSQHINANANQYAAGAHNHGQTVAVREDKPPKMHRDRSLSKLVAMNRRLETQMNEGERIDTLHQEPFDMFDCYTEYSETPEPMTSSSQFTNNDCMANQGDTDNNNNNNCNDSNNVQKNYKEADSQLATNDPVEWRPAAQSETSSVDDLINVQSVPSNVKISERSNSTPPNAPDFGTDAPNGPPLKSSIIQNANKKIKNKKANSKIRQNSSAKRPKRRDKKISTNTVSPADLKTDTIPLPGFQQAFGSTEIGRFSEIFFNVSGSPIEVGILESEADTLSPQTWEMGDSLDGPHLNMLSNKTHSYPESLGSTDSPTASNNSYI